VGDKAAAEQRNEADYPKIFSCSIQIFFVTFKIVLSRASSDSPTLVVITLFIVPIAAQYGINRRKREGYYTYLAPIGKPNRRVDCYAVKEKSTFHRRV